MKKEIQATTVVKNGKLTAIASTEDQDRAGDVLLVKNWDFNKFKMNPVLQAGHDYRPQYTIGKAENIRVEDNKVLFEPVFHEITPLAKQLKKMYEEGFLKAWSVGFIPGTTQTKGESGGSLNELLEVSAVAVPANAFALMKSFEMPESELASEIKEWMDTALDKGEEPVAEQVEEKSEEPVEEKVEEKGMVELMTGETNGHSHTATVDEETGDGSTNEVEGHSHDVVAWEVQEAEGHTHSLSKETEEEPSESAPAEMSAEEVAEIPEVVAEEKTEPTLDEQLAYAESLVKTLRKMKESTEPTEVHRQEVSESDTIDLKEGRIISKKNRQTLENARDAIQNVLDMETRSGEEDVEQSQVKESEVESEVKEAVVEAPKRKITEREITLRTLQKIAKVANQGLCEAKKSK